MTTSINVGIIGCGHISTAYLRSSQHFINLNITACADIDLQRAQAQAAKFGVPKACHVAELLADPEIEVVVNLTVPAVHAQVSLAVLEAKKSLYSEKPLATTSADGQAILRAARAKGLFVGCAPDTFLGGGLQTCIKLINDGAIGTPVAATAFVLNHGMEHWHPDPFFFYQPGAGPLFDMGPYYLTTLVAMLGPIRRIASSTAMGFSERTVTSTPKAGTKVSVNTPTHVTGTLDFTSGVVGTLITSFDVWYHQLPRIEIYGTEGTLSAPDPNTFGGPVLLRRARDSQWQEVPLTHGYTENCRGIGLADMVNAMHTGRVHRANGEMAYHVLEAMEALLQSSYEDRHMTLASSCERPESLSPGKQSWTSEH